MTAPDEPAVNCLASFEYHPREGASPASSDQTIAHRSETFAYVRLVGQRTEEEDVGSPGLEALPDGLGGLVSNREGVLRERAEHSRRGFEAGVEIGLGPLHPALGVIPDCRDRRLGRRRFLAPEHPPSARQPGLSMG